MFHMAFIYIVQHQSYQTNLSEMGQTMLEKVKKSIFFVKKKTSGHSEVAFVAVVGITLEEKFLYISFQ